MDIKILPTTIVILLTLFGLSACLDYSEKDSGTQTPPYSKGDDSLEQLPVISDMPEGLIKELNKLGASDTAFIPLVDIINGDVRLLKNPNVTREVPSLNNSATEINRVMSMSIVNYKRNPHCQFVVINGAWEVFCYKK